MKQPASKVLVALVLAFTTSGKALSEVNDASSKQSCRTFVQSFYDWYSPIANEMANPGKSSGPFFPYALTSRPEIFSGHLTRSLLKDHEAQAKATEVVGLDYDPFLFSQDPCASYVAEDVTLRAGHCFVEVHSVCEGKKSSVADVVPELEFVENQWVFLNFHYGKSDSGGLLASLKALSEVRVSTSSQMETIASPDGTIIASVKYTRASEATRESIIELLNPNRRLLAKHDYSSKDGEHGYGMVKGAWTPDSQFFVFSLESSGGHSAWHPRVYFFSRKQREFISLDEKLKDAVVNPQFTISPPDIVTVELMSNKQKRSVSLGKLP
jgi:hypothetical protein